MRVRWYGPKNFQKCLSETSSSIWMSVGELFKYAKSWFFVIFNPNFQSFLTFKPKINDTHEFCVAQSSLDTDSDFFPFIWVRLRVNLENAADVVLLYFVPWPDNILESQEWLKIWVENQARSWYKSLPTIQSDENVWNRHFWKFLSLNHRTHMIGTHDWKFCLTLLFH